MQKHYTLGPCGYVARLVETDGALRVSYVKQLGDGSYENNSVDVTAEAILAATGEQRFEDFSTYYGVMLDTGYIQWVNKYLETYFCKTNGAVYTRYLDKFVCIQVYVPFGGTTLDDAVVRVCSESVPSLNGEDMDASLEVDRSSESLHAFAENIYPMLTVLQSNPGEVRVQVTQGGQPLARSGIKVWTRQNPLDILVTKTCLTDANGIASFDVVPGQTGTIDFGYRYYTNLVSVTI